MMLQGMLVPNKKLIGCLRTSTQCWRFKSGGQGEDYQYIQKSKLPTMHFQKSLPRLPIPKLEKTCERYLAAQKPLLRDSEFKSTETIVNKFRDGVGRTLQEALIQQDKQNKHTSYISEPWFDMYLRDRAPLPINYNPFLVFLNDPRPKYNAQLICATNQLISSLRFMKSLQANILEPEVFHLNPKKSDTDLFRTVTGLLPPSLSWYGAFLFKAYPLDMSQYRGLFNASRIPKMSKDKIFQNESARHILVMKGGKFYIFDVLDKNGNILPREDILACMKYIHEDTTPAAEYPLGYLTTENRDTWAKARQHLEQTGNAETLNLIDSSIFNLALDDVETGEDVNHIVHHFLHADGRNRWFDKSFSLLIDQGGNSGVNFEHSWGDGVAVLRYFQEVHRDRTQKPQVHPDTRPSDCSPHERVKKLEFKLDETAKQYILKAKEHYEDFYKSLQVDIFQFPDFGKNECKVHGVSPDSVMQLGFQLAFHKQTGKFTATYESCSTAAFKHGRTETVRPCTVATKSFCEAVNSSKRPATDALKDMIKLCSKVHGQLTKEAAMGEGFDRHLFGLRKIAEQRGGSLPEIFQDPAYAALNYNVLSTSTLSSPAVMVGGFGPVVKDGYGVGYSIMDSTLGAVVSSYPPHRNGAEFVNCLQEAFSDIRGILKK